MAVTLRYLGEKNKKLEGTKQRYGETFFSIDKSFAATFIVQSTGDRPTEDDLLNYQDPDKEIPKVGDVVRNAYCEKKTVNEVEASAGLWEIHCTFNSRLPTGEDIVQVNWNVEEVEEIVTFDQVTGVPVTNSVGEPLPLKTLITIPVLDITRIEDDFDPDLILNYGNRVNSATFYGAPPLCALMKGPTGNERYIDGIKRYEVNYKIMFNLMIDPDTLQPRGWLAYLLNHGTFYKDVGGGSSSTTVYRRFTLDGRPTTGNLNLDGTARPFGLPPIYLPYNRYRLADFNELDLGPF